MSVYKEKIEEYIILREQASETERAEQFPRLFREIYELAKPKSEDEVQNELSAAYFDKQLSDLRSHFDEFSKSHPDELSLKFNELLRLIEERNKKYIEFSYGSKIVAYDIRIAGVAEALIRKLQPNHPDIQAIIQDKCSKIFEPPGIGYGKSFAAYHDWLAINLSLDLNEETLTTGFQGFRDIWLHTFLERNKEDHEKQYHKINQYYQKIRSITQRLDDAVSATNIKQLMQELNEANLLVNSISSTDISWKHKFNQHKKATDRIYKQLLQKINSKHILVSLTDNARLPYEHISQGSELIKLNPELYSGLVPTLVNTADLPISLDLSRADRKAYEKFRQIYNKFKRNSDESIQHDLQAFIEEHKNSQSALGKSLCSLCFGMQIQARVMLTHSMTKPSTQTEFYSGDFEEQNKQYLESEESKIMQAHGSTKPEMIKFPPSEISKALGQMEPLNIGISSIVNEEVPKDYNLNVSFLDITTLQSIKTSKELITFKQIADRYQDCRAKYLRVMRDIEKKGYSNDYENMREELNSILKEAQDNKPKGDLGKVYERMSLQCHSYILQSQIKKNKCYAWRLNGFINRNIRPNLSRNPNDGPKSKPSNR